MTPAGRQTVLAPVLWMAAGACWVGQLFLPWTSHGNLSTSSLADAVRLIRAGAVDSLVPGWLAPVLLTPSVAGLGLVALAGLRGAVVQVVRSVLAVAGAVVLVVGGWLLTGHQPGRLGVGGFTAVGGVVLGAAAWGIGRATAHPPSPSQEATP